MDEDCRLSVVITSRNDDHGGGMLRRFQIFLDALLSQAQRHGLSGELIVVEWNPPDGPRLHETLDLGAAWEGFPVRFIEVPPELHRSLPHAGDIPLFQMIAKNVGIRRARGRFILATNPDILFTDELLRFLTSGPLDPAAMYRLDRTDVAAEVPDDADLDTQLAWCRDHILRVHTRWGSFPPLELGALAARAGQASRDLLVLARRASSSLFRMLSRLWRVRPRHVAGSRSLWRKLIRLPVRGSLRALQTAAYLVDSKPKVHTNGCGDFTLLERSAWEALRGYPEIPVWSMHLDSLLCYMAVAAGYEQRILRPPARMYHLEHGKSWVTMDLGERLRTFARKPWLDTSLLEEIWGAMWLEQAPVIYNDDGWGFGQHRLHEVVYTGETPSPRAASASVS